MLPETIDDLLNIAGSDGGQGPQPAASAELLRPVAPSLMVLARADGSVVYADDFGSGVGLEFARPLAAEVARQLAEKEACGWALETPAGRRLALAVRLPESTGAASAACLVDGSAAAGGLLAESSPAAVLAGAVAWAATQYRAREAELRARVEQLAAGEEALRTSYSRSLADALDEHERRLQEQQEHTARLTAVMATAAEGIITIDGRGRVESFNTAASQIFDYAPEEIIGQNVSLLMPPPHCQQHDEYLARRLRDEGVKGGLATRELIGQRRDGTTFPLELAVSEVALDTGRVFTGIVRDITERRMLESQLVQAQKLESIGQLAAGIAHEINTPTQFIGDNMRFLEDALSDLAPLLAGVARLHQAASQGGAAAELVAAVAAELAAAAGEADLPYLIEEIPKAIDQCLEGVARVANIVRSMKEFSHPGSDEMQPVDLNRALESTLTVCRNEWKYVADLVTDFAPDLPLVSCLPGECNQVFLNLIINAAHAIADKQQPGSADKGTITVSTRPAGAWVEIRIADTGTGIPERIRSKIFDPFFTTKEVGRGTGQGLAIARSVLADKHGGDLSFTTEAGRGTTFIIRLPSSPEVSPQTGRNHD